MFNDIFKYWNGEYDENDNPIYVYGDPVEIDFVLRDTLDGIDINTEINRIRTVNEDGSPILSPSGQPIEIPLRTIHDVYNKLSPGIIAGFQIKPLDRVTSKGMTLSMQMDLLANFFNFLANVKKNTDVQQSSSISTDGLPQGETETETQPTMESLTA